jgi:ribonucleoside-diphosphate reductase alpha chain
MCDMGLSVPTFLVDNTYKFSKVTSTEPIDELDTFDVSVPDGNSYIANSLISHNTVNLPNNVTQKTVGEIYELAWRLGCKGMTVYREGSRDGVILSAEKVDSMPKTTSPERPKELSCDVFHTTVDGKPYFVLVGVWSDGSPYEIFSGKNGFLPKHIKRGKIIRRRKGYYRAEFEDSDIELSPITSMSSDMEGAITRLTSAALRHGADVLTVVKQLERVAEEGTLHSFARAIARCLKKYIQDGTVEKGDVCPECSGQLVRQSGCVECGCGWSKCV